MLISSTSTRIFLSLRKKRRVVLLRRIFQDGCNLDFPFCFTIVVLAVDGWRCFILCRLSVPFGVELVERHNFTTEKYAHASFNRRLSSYPTFLFAVFQQ